MKYCKEFEEEFDEIYEKEHRKVLSDNEWNDLKRLKQKYSTDEDLQEFRSKLGPMESMYKKILYNRWLRERNAKTK